jgi:hypothetical protein
MIKNINNVLTIALFAFAIWALLSMRSCWNNSNRADNLDAAIAAQNDTIKYWKNKYGDSIASRQVVRIGSSDADKFLNRDSLANKFNTSKDDIEAFYQVATTGSATIPQAGQPEIRYVYPDDYIAPDRDKPADTPRMCLSDSFISPYYRVFANVCAGGGGYVSIKAYDTISLLQKRGKVGSLFNRRHITQVDVMNSNKDVKVASVKGYVINDDPGAKAVEIYGQSGVMFLGGINQPSLPYIGAGAEFQFGRLSIAASWNKSMVAPANNFVDLKARFRLIRF